MRLVVLYEETSETLLHFSLSLPREDTATICMPGTGLANILLLGFPASLIVRNKFLFISVQGTQFIEFYMAAQAD